MKKKGFSAEQVIGKLREVEVLLSQGSTVGEVSRKLGVTEQTYYRWRREYGGMRIDQARSPAIFTGRGGEKLFPDGEDAPGKCYRDDS